MQLTQLQVWIAIAAIASPSLLALIGILLNSQNANRLDKKIDGLDAKLDGKIDSLDAKLNGKIDGLDAKLNGKIDGLDAKIDKVRSELLDEIRDTRQFLSSRIDNLVTIMMGHGERIAKLEERNPPR